MWQSLIADYQIIDRSLLVKDVPPDKAEDRLPHLPAGLEGNLDPTSREPLPESKPAGDLRRCGPKAITRVDRLRQRVVQRQKLTVYPGRTVTVKDPVAYGLICVQGYGKFGQHAISAPSMIRFGEMTEDEFFVTCQAVARASRSRTAARPSRW